LDLRRRNQEFLRPWEPRGVNPFPLTDAGIAGSIERMQLEREEDRRFTFGIFERAGDRLVGTISLANVSRGAWQNATVGYFVDRECNGRGYATEAVKLVVQVAFERLGLHRVQAGVMPRNHASNRVMEKAGFRFEGYSPSYLQINGVWEGHNMYALTVEDVSGAGGERGDGRSERFPEDPLG
jgi:ribosomal-protein-alanine N-acetyltransferase